MTAPQQLVDARTRAADLFERFATPVAARLLRRYHGVDPQVVADAVVDAVLALARGPDAVGAGTKGEYHVAEVARQRLRVWLRGEVRRRRREEKYSTAVTAARGGGPSPDDQAALRESAARTRDAVAHTDEERRALDLWLAGVTDPDELAGRLGSTRDAAVTLLARFRQRIGRERRRQARTASEDAP